MTASEPSRLDRLEALAESILLSLQQQQTVNAAIQEAQNVDRAEFRAHVEDVLQSVNTLAQTSDRQFNLIQGLQTENRRILERLEAHFSNGHGGEN